MMEKQETKMGLTQRVMEPESAKIWERKRKSKKKEKMSLRKTREEGNV